jgi:AcrR family transcriptional regulator
MKEMNSMPKVKDGYLESKKNQILDAAFAVCNRKPAYDVTMSDIVAETGMSQGGVYKYFGNIDSVFSALIDRANSQGDYTRQIDEVMESGDPPEIVLRDLFSFSLEYFSDMLISYNKLLFELATFFAHSPDRRERINSQVTTQSTFAYLSGCIFRIISEQTERGYFTPTIPVEELFAFIVAAFDGIIRDVTLTRCYPDQKSQAGGIVFDERKLTHCLYSSVMFLLGKNDMAKGFDEQ